MNRELYMKYFVIKMSQRFSLNRLKKELEGFGYPQDRLTIEGKELAQILLNAMLDGEDQ